MQEDITICITESISRVVISNLLQALVINTHKIHAANISPLGLNDLQIVTMFKIQHFLLASANRILMARLFSKNLDAISHLFLLLAKRTYIYHKLANLSRLLA